ncbi:MAG: hypothetical protein QMD99_21575 [Rhizobiaceae bacterium]|nr:hypothetical protein [Rhizobiaceae bacterium]
MTKGIPAEILAMLREEWEGSQEGYSAFESVAEEQERLRNPSYYVHDKGRPEIDNNGMRSSEAIAMLKAALFEGLVHDRGNSVFVNEHLQHALVDFCNEVTTAWRRFEERVERIPRKS